MNDVRVILDKGAFMPIRGHKNDAGLDLRTPRKVSVMNGQSTVIDTGVHLLIPAGYCGLLVSKSGLYVVKACTTTGLIDPDFTGSIKVRIENNSRDFVNLEAGDKFTQIVFLKCEHPRLVLDVVQHKDERGEGGYGSTGR